MEKTPIEIQKLFYRPICNEEEIDRILEKVKTSGYNSLTEEEKQKLFDASQR